MLHVQEIGLNDSLRIASSKGHTDKVLQLVEAGATFQVDADGRTALHLAGQFGHDDTVAALLLAGASVNALDFAGRSPLQLASAEGHVQVVQQLVRHGARIDHQDESQGNTAAHEAAWKGYSHTLEALCKAKANLYLKNIGGFAPIHLACQNGHNQSCRVLLLAGCKPDIKNNYGDTPIHTSARYGHAGVMRILLSALCKVSEPNKNSDTALHIAVAMGRRKLTRILLQAKSNTTIVNKQGETVMDIAKRKKFQEIQSILLNPPTTNREKKREKSSGTSSKESGKKQQQEKMKKTKHSHKVHFKNDQIPKWSPYGCHYSPGPSIFPTPKLDTLPQEPLAKGEQYYLDLSGNIRKGPIGNGYACYCAPFFQHIQHKMEGNKKELIQHMDSTKADLKGRIIHLEKKTKGQIIGLGQLVQEKLAADKADQYERTDRKVEKQEKSLQTVRRELHCLIQEKIRQFEQKYGRPYDQIANRSFMITREKQNLKKFKSEEMLSECASLQHQHDLNQPTYDLSLSRRHVSAPFLQQGSQDSGYNATHSNDVLIVNGNSLTTSPEFDMTAPFFDTVTNEMEKWYERRLVSLERKAEEKLLVNKVQIQDRIKAIEDQLTKLNDSFSQSEDST